MGWVKDYPDAGHILLNDHRGEGGWSMQFAALGHLPVLADTIGGYHEPSAQDTRRRILSFFDRHVRSVGLTSWEERLRRSEHAFPQPKGGALCR